MKLKKPEVSIIIPTHNRASFLQKAISSVLNQTWPDYELLIVDDGSKDNTKEIIKKAQGKDNRILYFYQENKGQAVARNLGIEKSSGEYIAFLDSDDEWFPEKLEKQLALFGKNPKLGFIGCNSKVRVLDDSGKVRKEYNLFNKLFPAGKEHFTFEDFLSMYSAINTSGILIRKKVLSTTGFFDEACTVHQDYELWIRLSENFAFECVHQILVIYNEWRGGVSKTASFLIRAKVKKYILHKHKTSYQKYPKAKAKVLRYIGTEYMLAGNKKEAVKYFLKSIKTYPFSIRGYMNLFFVPLGSMIYKKILILKRT